jgi:hypothetical protein
MTISYLRWRAHGDFASCIRPSRCRGKRAEVGWVERRPCDGGLWIAATHGVRPATFHKRRYQAKRAVESAHEQFLAGRIAAAKRWAGGGS